MKQPPSKSMRVDQVIDFLDDFDVDEDDDEIDDLENSVILEKLPTTNLQISKENEENDKNNLIMNDEDYEDDDDEDDIPLSKLAQMRNEKMESDDHDQDTDDDDSDEELPLAKLIQIRKSNNLKNKLNELQLKEKDFGKKFDKWLTVYKLNTKLKGLYNIIDSPLVLDENDVISKVEDISFVYSDTESDDEINVNINENVKESTRHLDLLTRSPVIIMDKSNRYVLNLKHLNRKIF